MKPTRPSPPDTSARGLRQHALALAAAWHVRVVEDPTLKPDDAMSLSSHRLVVVAPITEETTYAVALHEIGHQASPTGAVRHIVKGRRERLTRLEEESAWEWARHYALVWTPLMEQIAQWALSTYALPDPPADRIRWDEWK